MTGNIFAFCMIAMLLGTIVCLWRRGARPTFRGSLMGVLLTLVCFVGLAILTPTHACRRGGTMTPELLGSVLAGFAFAALQRGVKARAIVVLLLCGYALTLWGMHLVHHTPYVGDPKWAEELHRISSFSLTRARDGLMAASAEHPDTILPEGWVEESWRKATGEQLFPDRLGYMSGTVSHFWHTWFTGIYRVEQRHNGVWCPGGAIPECAGKLKLKDREEPIPASRGTALPRRSGEVYEDQAGKAPWPGAFP